jgi:hypothetical protein
VQRVYALVQDGRREERGEERLLVRVRVMVRVRVLVRDRVRVRVRLARSGSIA